ncbi:hypothetical protein CDV49_10410 [Haematobacter genomosp. 1]|uniref:Uncharacterized protein n=2 Tax=Haematobacter genomosp. 1 TaxID=366618 RepID=A0A212ABB5_9RHOB|nr:hypothetical protein CDV49_10410 [Haematobacter genomosp. 1]
MGQNLATSLKCRRRRCPMQRYDGLPPELRAWLAGAALPWSPHSALRLWSRALREAQGDAGSARARLDRTERRMLERDRLTIWGRSYPRPAGLDETGEALPAGRRKGPVFRGRHQS